MSWILWLYEKSRGEVNHRIVWLQVNLFRVGSFEIEEHKQYSSWAKTSYSEQEIPSKTGRLTRLRPTDPSIRTGCLRPSYPANLTPLVSNNNHIVVRSSRDEAGWKFWVLRELNGWGTLWREKNVAGSQSAAQLTNVAEINGTEHGCLPDSKLGWNLMTFSLLAWYSATTCQGVQGRHQEDTLLGGMKTCTKINLLNANTFKCFLGYNPEIAFKWATCTASGMHCFNSIFELKRDISI